MPPASQAPTGHALAPPTLFPLAGHPVRWRLLRELATSDRRVRELVEATAGTQPLVSYHLRRLRAAGLVASRRSSFDARDSYYSLDPARFGELLAEAGEALHPALGPAPRATRAASARPVRVLFLCTGNSARSQIAEALLERLSAGSARASSAGSRPKPVHPEAVRVLRARGIDSSSRVSKHLDTLARKRFDYVVTLCDRVREVCPEQPAGTRTIHWSIPDPAAAEGGRAGVRAAFERTAAELEARIGFLLRRIEADRAQAARRRR